MKLSRKLRRYTLSPKFKLVVEQHPAALSAAVGIFVGCGSRFEATQLQGVTHLAEHIFFKGTSTKSAEDISLMLERFGGELNAFTEREFTCFHANVPRDQLITSLELLFEILFDSLFEKDDFQKERDVVVQELRGYEDSPDDEFWDGLLETPWAKHALGRRIGGYAANVGHLAHEHVTQFIKTQFLRAPMVVVVASSLDPKRVRREVVRVLQKAKKYLWGDALEQKIVRPPRRKPKSPQNFNLRSKLRHFAADQVQTGFIFPGVSVNHPFEVVWAAASAILGAGSSSRLFREIREARGLAYNASVHLSSHSDAGLVVGHIVTDKKHLFQAVGVAGEVFRDFSRGVPREEFHFVKSMLEGSLYLNYEGVSQRMETLGRQELLMGRVMSMHEALAELKLVTFEALNRVARNFQTMPCFYALGPVSARDLPRMVAAWKGKK